MKEKVLSRYGFTEVSPIDFYTDIFRLGEHLIQEKDEKGGQFKTNPIAIAHRAGHVRHIIMFEDDFEARLQELGDYDWAYMSCLTYFGKRNVNERQSKMYAMVFDLDGVTDKSLASFIDGALCDVYPLPNYIVLSGNGVHLYYVFEEPIPLYPMTKTQLKSLKYDLTKLIWNERTSSIARPQYQGINQAYRIPGTKAKRKGVVARAFKVSDHPTSIEYLNGFASLENRVDVSRMRQERGLTLDEARKLYPDWYERRVLNGEPRGAWKTDRHVYDWWKQQIYESAEYGHRYFCVMALAIYAVKCGIGEDELRADAESFVEMLNVIHPDDPFTQSDVDSAMECYDADYATFPRAEIERLTGISIPERKRNHRSRWEHLQAETWEIDGAEVENPCKRNREKALEKARAEGRTGRPRGSGTKEMLVLDYFRDNPQATVEQASRELEISPTTVQKWKPRRGKGATPA